MYINKRRRKHLYEKTRLIENIQFQRHLCPFVRVNLYLLPLWGVRIKYHGTCWECLFVLFIVGFAVTLVMALYYLFRPEILYAKWLIAYMEAELNHYEFKYLLYRKDDDGKSEIK